MNTPPPPSVTNADTLKVYQRLCHVIKRQNFDGYGFNLHSEKGKIGQYIGKIDENSPAETAGLKEGDRIIEVNGVNIGSETHKQVVQRIKAISNEVQLLVIDPLKEKEILQMQKTILNATAVTTKSTNVGQPDPEILTSSTITIKSTSTTSSSAKENNKVIMSTFAKQPPPPSFTALVSSTEQAEKSLIVDDDTQKISTKEETERTITSTSSEIKPEESEDIVDNCNIKIPILFEKITKNYEKDPKLNSKNNAMKLNDTNNHNYNQNNFQHTDEIFITNNENNSNSINNIHLNNNNLNKNQTNFNHEDNLEHKNSKSITETTTITTTSMNDDHVNDSGNNKHSNDITIKFDASKNIDDIKEKTKSFQETITTEEQNNRQQQYIDENEHSTKKLCNDNDQNENLTFITTQKQKQKNDSEENKNDQKPNNDNTSKQKQLYLPMTAAEMRAKLMAKKKYDPKNDSVDLRKKFEIIQKL